MNKVSTGATLVIPDNVPGDVVTVVQKMLDDAAAVDAKDGGIGAYGYFICDGQNGIRLGGCMSQGMANDVAEAVALAHVKGGGACSCPLCQAERAGLTISKFEQLLKDSRPSEPKTPPAVAPRPSLFSRLFRRGRK